MVREETRVNHDYGKQNSDGKEQYEVCGIYMERRELYCLESGLSYFNFSFCPSSMFGRVDLIL